MNFTDTDPRGDEFDDDETGCSGLLVLLALLAAFALTARWLVQADTRPDVTGGSA